MGSAGKKVKSAAGGLASDVVAVTSAGTVNYDPNTGGVKINANGTDNLSTFMGGATGSKTQASMAPPMPEIPKAEDPADQARKAASIAEAKLAEQAGVKSKGLSSTILGGSVSDDNSVLKKRKLLGE